MALAAEARVPVDAVMTELHGRVRAATILPDVQGSDHCPITLTLE